MVVVVVVRFYYFCFPFNLEQTVVGGAGNGGIDYSIVPFVVVGIETDKQKREDK